MRVTVHVAAADLRSVPFARYAAVLHNLIVERFQPSAVTVAPDGRTVVVIEDGADEVESGEIAELARQITDPAVRDGYFG